MIRPRPGLSRGRAAVQTLPISRVLGVDTLSGIGRTHMTGVREMLNDIEREVAYTRHLIGRDELDARVMQAMSRVPRHEFVPESERRYAYENGPAPIGHGQTISQPYIVALMSDLLETSPGDRILEVGTGSGYQAAILSLLVEEVHSVEIIEALSSSARDRLHRLGFRNVVCHLGDGYRGWPEAAPYDGIIVTAAAPFIPSALLDQLKPGRKLVIPLGEPYSHQELMVVEKSLAGEVTEQLILGVAFVPLVSGSG